MQRIVGQNKNKIFATYDNENYIIFPNANLANLRNEKNNIKFFLALLNSTLISYFYNMYFGESNTNLTKKAFESIPIMDISECIQTPFIDKVDLIIDLNKKLQVATRSFVDELELDHVPNKLQDFEELELEEFVKEYKKAKKLKFADKLEERNFKNDWTALFENDKKIALELKSQIAQTDKEIDTMVYKLYGLTADEISIVESI